MYVVPGSPLQVRPCLKGQWIDYLLGLGYSDAFWDELDVFLELSIQRPPSIADLHLAHYSLHS